MPQKFLCNEKDVVFIVMISELLHLLVEKVYEVNLLYQLKYLLVS